MIKIDEINTKIDTSKEVLDAFPKNNKKDIDAYIKKINGLINEFSECNSLVLKEIEKRYNKFKKVKVNAEISRLQAKINHYDDVLYLLNDTDTSYEKMDVDRVIQNLNYYYKKNLKIVNESILYILKRFEEVGVTLTEEDFCYSNYVKEYIGVFLWELNNGDINSTRIKEKFEQIYWKCPEIITHIELNFRYLYLKNEKDIDKYYIKQKGNLIKNFTAEDINNRYIEIKKHLIEKTEADKANIVNKFDNKELNVKDYSKNVIQSNYLKFINSEILNNADEDTMNEFNINLMKLANSVYEYRSYLKFKFIIDDIKNIYLEKDKYKKVYNDSKQKVTKSEQKLLKLNKKISLKKEVDEKFVSQRDTLILEIKQLYKELDKNRVYNKVATQLSDTSSIRDILFFAASFYKYLFDCIKDNQSDLSEEEIDKTISEVRNFVRWPYFTILDNILISEDKDILIIIKDRYQLLNINISKEDLEINNLDNIIDVLKKIEISHYIKINKIRIEDIEALCEFQKILINK